MCLALPWAANVRIDVPAVGVGSVRRRAVPAAGMAGDMLRRVPRRLSTRRRRRAADRQRVGAAGLALPTRIPGYAASPSWRVRRHDPGAGGAGGRLGNCTVPADAARTRRLVRRDAPMGIARRPTGEMDPPPATVAVGHTSAGMRSTYTGALRLGLPAPDRDVRHRLRASPNRKARARNANS